MPVAVAAAAAAPVAVATVCSCSRSSRCCYCSRQSSWASIVLMPSRSQAALPGPSRTPEAPLPRLAPAAPRHYPCSCYQSRRGHQLRKVSRGQGGEQPGTELVYAERVASNVHQECGVVALRPQPWQHTRVAPLQPDGLHSQQGPPTPDEPEYARWYKGGQVLGAACLLPPRDIFKGMTNGVWWAKWCRQTANCRRSHARGGKEWNQGFSANLAAASRPTLGGISCQAFLCCRCHASSPSITTWTLCRARPSRHQSRIISNGSSSPTRNESKGRGRAWRQMLWRASSALR